MLVIPAIDLKDGLCVRLRQGNMDDASIFSKDPSAMASQWVKAGARRLHIVDLDGAFAGEPVNQHIIRAIVKQNPQLPVQVGGGIRNLDTIAAYIDAGVSWVIIGTQAVRNPAFVEKACKAFAGKVIVGIDAKDGKVAVEGWAEVSDVKVKPLVKQFEQVGVTGVIYTDISRDGMMQGVNLAAIAELADSSSLPIIASGGVTNLQDIEDLAKLSSKGVTGVIAGRSLYEDTLNLQDAQILADRLTMLPQV